MSGLSSVPSSSSPFHSRSCSAHCDTRSIFANSPLLSTRTAGLLASGCTVHRREEHDRGYDRGADLSLVTEGTARRLKQLYRDNRAAAYYRDTIAAGQQADPMFDLAVDIHDYVTNFARFSHECQCQR